MKTAQPRYLNDHRKFSKPYNQKSSKSVTDADFEKILFWHLLYNVEAFAAVFVLNPSDGFRLVFGIESLYRVMRKSPVTPSSISISDSMPALTQSTLEQLWNEVGEKNKAAMTTEFAMESGGIIAVDISFHALEFAHQKMLVGYLRDIREPKLAENMLHQLQCRSADTLAASGARHGQS